MEETLRHPRHGQGHLIDIAITLALGGDTLSDSSVLRDGPDLYGAVASNSTITRLIRTLADEGEHAVAAINTARAAARARVWELSGAQAPNHNSDARSPLIVDMGSPAFQHDRARWSEPPDLLSPIFTVAPDI